MSHAPPSRSAPPSIMHDAYSCPSTLQSIMHYSFCLCVMGQPPNCLLHDAQGGLCDLCSSIHEVSRVGGAWPNALNVLPPLASPHHWSERKSVQILTFILHVELSVEYAR